jgi:acyl carrier protein
MSERDADTKALEEFRRLIEESPLGTAEARAVRNRVSRQRAERLAQRLAADDTDNKIEDEMDRDLRDLLSALDAPAPPPPPPGDRDELLAHTEQAFGTFLPKRRWRLSDDQIITTIAEIVEEVTGIEPSEVTPEKSFVDDLDIDSLSMVEIAVQTECRYGVKIPDADLAGLRTVGDVLRYIQDLEDEHPEAAAVVIDMMKEWDA